MRNAGLEEAQAGIKTCIPMADSCQCMAKPIQYCKVKKIKIKNDCQEKYQPHICRWHHPYGRKWRTKELLDESERGELKRWIKAQYSGNKVHGIRPHPFMTNRWRNSGNGSRLDFGVSKITADGDCSHEIKRCLLLGRKVMTNLDSIFKSRDITLPTKVCLVKALVFPVVMYGCESWTIKKAECQRIDWCFWTVVLEKTLESHLNSK